MPIIIRQPNLTFDLIKSLESMVFENNRLAEQKFKFVCQQNPVFLVAYDGNKPIGFKLGYELDSDTFYSWLGGTHPDYRRHGIAQALLEKQEQILIQKGFKTVKFKTYPHFKPMISLARKKGYSKLGVQDSGGSIWFAKRLP